jgi:catechol 2,3-dioxygenase-like lactoylglutathione lyase family enzyme
VGDQERALRFYTDVLGFVKKTDVSQGPYRWLTLASPEEPDGTKLQLALNDDPEAKTYQQAQFQQGQPAARARRIRRGHTRSDRAHRERRAPGRTARADRPGDPDAPVGLPEEVAATAASLCSDDAAFVTG